MSPLLRRRRLAPLVLAIGLLATACGSSDVAEVGDSALSQETLDELIELQFPGSATGETVGRAEAAEMIRIWVFIESVYAELAARGYEPDPAIMQQVRTEYELIAAGDPNAPDPESAIGELVVRDRARNLVLVDYLLEFAQVEVDWPELLCSSHVLVESEEEARAARERVLAGEPFATVAAQLSIGPSASAGGDLGCVDPAGFVPEFSEAAVELTPGEVSEPVQTQFGWHVILLNSLSAERPENPEDVLVLLQTNPEYLELLAAIDAQSVSVDGQYGTWDPTQQLVVTG